MHGNNTHDIVQIFMNKYIKIGDRKDNANINTIKHLNENDTLPKNKDEYLG